MSFQFAARHFADAVMVDDAAQVAEMGAVTRHFDLPPVLHGATVALYLGFLGLMGMAFRSQDMGLVIAICVVYIVMAFGVPTLWSRMKPDHGDHAVTWDAFSRDGVQCATGHLKAGEAMAQVLILPVLIFVWGLAIASVAAAVAG